jgi:hypothetical protein
MVHHRLLHCVWAVCAVHTYGDVTDPSGLRTGGHFVGICNSCRPSSVAQEVGLLDNGTPLTVTGSSTTYSFVETVAKLRGPNTIVGRGVVIHGNGNGTSAGAGVRIAQCAIGRLSSVNQVGHGSRVTTTCFCCTLPARTFAECGITHKCCAWHTDVLLHSASPYIR